MQELPKWFQNKKLLFLGCSLAMDRTMEVLQQATVDNPCLDYYTILACRPEEMHSELEILLARSCLVPYLPLAYIKNEKYPKIYRKADNLDVDLPELLRQIGAVHSVAEDSKDYEEQEKIDEGVVLDCPDLVNEYLVLQQVCDKGKLKLLLLNGWDNDPIQIFFCGRLFRDYPEKLEGNSKFWKVFFCWETGISAIVICPNIVQPDIKAST